MGLLNALKQYVSDAMPGGLLNAEWTPQSVRTAGEAMSMIPNPMGDVASGLLAVDDMRKGNYGDAALNGVGLLPFIPAMGGMIKQTGKLGKSLDLPKEIENARRLPVFGTLPSSSEWDAAGNVFKDMNARISALNNGDYVVKYSPQFGGRNSPFFAVGDNAEELARYALDKVSRSESAVKSADGRTLLGKLKKEYGDVFELGKSTQSSSQYITHTPSGTKIRISDHDLPLHYEQADVDLHKGTSVSDMFDAIKKYISGN